MALAEMEVRYRCGVMIHLDTVLFMYHDGNGGVLVAEFVEVPEELDGCIAPIRILGGSSLGNVEEEPVSKIVACFRSLAILRHTYNDTALRSARRLRGECYSSSFAIRIISARRATRQVRRDYEEKRSES